MYVYITPIAHGGYRISCDAVGYSMKFYGYSRNDCIKRFRFDTGLKHKWLNIIDI